MVDLSTRDNQIAVAQQFAQSVAPQSQAPQSTPYTSTALGGSGGFGGTAYYTPAGQAAQAPQSLPQAPQQATNIQNFAPIKGIGSGFVLPQNLPSNIVNLSQLSANALSNLGYIPNFDTQGNLISASYYTRGNTDLGNVQPKQDLGYPLSLNPSGMSYAPQSQVQSSFADKVFGSSQTPLFPLFPSLSVTSNEKVAKLLYSPNLKELGSVISKNAPISFLSSGLSSPIGNIINQEANKGISLLSQAKLVSPLGRYINQQAEIGVSKGIGLISNNVPLISSGFSSPLRNLINQKAEQGLYYVGRNIPVNVIESGLTSPIGRIINRNAEIGVSKGAKFISQNAPLIREIAVPPTNRLINLEFGNAVNSISKIPPSSLINPIGQIINRQAEIGIKRGAEFVSRGIPIIQSGLTSPVGNLINQRTGQIIRNIRIPRPEVISPLGRIINLELDKGLIGGAYGVSKGVSALKPYVNNPLRNLINLESARGLYKAGSGLYKISSKIPSDLIISPEGRLINLQVQRGLNYLKSVDFNKPLYKKGELPFGLQQAVNLANNPNTKESKDIISGKTFNPFVPTFFISSKTLMGNVAPNEFGGYSPITFTGKTIPQSVKPPKKIENVGLRTLQAGTYYVNTPFGVQKFTTNKTTNTTLLNKSQYETLTTTAPELASLTAGISLGTLFTPILKTGTEGQAEATTEKQAEKTISEQISESKFSELGSQLAGIEKKVAEKSGLDKQIKYLSDIKKTLTTEEQKAGFETFVKDLIDRQVLKVAVKINPDGTLTITNLATPKPVPVSSSTNNLFQQIIGYGELKGAGAITGVINPANVRSVNFVSNQPIGQGFRETPFTTEAQLILPYNANYPALTLNSRIGESTGTASLLKTSLNQQQNQKENQLTSSFSLSASSELTGQAQPLQTRQNQGQQTKQGQQYKQEQIQQPGQAQGTISLLSPQTIGSGITLLPKDLSSGKSKLTLKNVSDAFIALTKRRGKLIELGRFKTPQEAFSKSEQVALGTLARRVEVIRASTGKPVELTSLPNYLRPAKRERGVYIQKNALSARSEVSEILSAKRQSPKGFFSSSKKKGRRLKL